MFKDYAFLFQFLLVWNAIVFLAYGLDKYLAKKDAWRISEKALLGATFAFGGIGGFLGMRFFHHKTQKPIFQILVPIAGVITLLFYFFSYL